MKPQKIVELSNHAHLKLKCHNFDQFIDKLFLRASKHNIINIHLNYEYVTSLFKYKQSLVNSSSFKSLGKKKPCKFVISSTWSLLQTIKSLLIDKHGQDNLDPQILLVENKDLLLKNSIQKRTFDIHLIQTNLKHASNTKKSLIDSRRATELKVSSKLMHYILENP